MKKGLLVKYGEIALRGKNRYIFENKLMKHIQSNIQNCGNYYIYKEFGRFFIDCVDDEFDFDLIIPKVTTVLGIIGICPCIKTENMDIENIRNLALDHMKFHFGDEKFSFKVETKRADKRYPIPSREVSADVGGYIFNAMENSSVDIKNPEITLFIELRKEVYIYSKIIKGFGGLPVGSSGTGLALLSGGIDSPVAAFLMAKRGMAVDGVYFHSPPFVSERAKIKVLDLAKRISVFTGSFKLYVIDFTDIQTYLHDNVQIEKLTILLKRAMLRIADRIARENGYFSLITGDSIGQVASQTMHSILAVHSAARLPVLRPLAGMDKCEIIDIAKKIETYDISIRPYEDCCTLFVADSPETKPKASIIENIESRLDKLEEKIIEAITNVEIIEL